MVGRVTAGRAAVVPSPVVQVVRGQGAQPEGREQFVAHAFHHLGLIVFRQHGMGQGHRENLVGPHTDVELAVLPDVAKVASAAVNPEALEKCRAHVAQNHVARQRFLAKARCKLIRKGQGIVPEGIDFNGAALPWRHGGIVGLRVHPGELGVGVACVQQAFGVHMNVQLSGPALACAVAGNNRLERGPGVFAHPGEMPGVHVKAALQRKGVPQGGVHGVVGVVALGRKHVGDEPVFDMPAHFGQNAQAKVRAASMKGQARQADERVAAPGVKPVVARQHFGPSRRGFDAELASDLAQVSGESDVGLVGAGALTAGGVPHPVQVLLAGACSHRQINAAFRAVGKGGHAHVQHARHKEVFAVGKAAFALFKVFHTAAPVRAWRERILLACLALDVERGQPFIGGDAEAVGQWGGFCAQVGIGVGKLVKIAVGQQGAQA